MQKRQIAFWVAAGLILITWMLLFRQKPPQPQKKAPPPAEETQPGTDEQEPTGPAPEEPEVEAPPETPEGPEITEETTEPEETETTETTEEPEEPDVIPEFEPELYALSNPYATFQISTRGGVVRQVTIETKKTSKGHGIVVHGHETYDFCPDNWPDSEQVPQNFYPLAIFSEEDGGLDLAEVEFKKVAEESDDGTLVLRYENRRVAVTRTFTLPEQGYRLETKLTVRNKTGARIKLPEYHLRVGTVHPVDRKDRRSETRLTVDSGSAKKLRPARGDKPPKDYPLSVVRWAAISNKYFTAILDARGPEANGELKARRVVSDTHYLGYADEERKKTKVYATGLSVALPDLALDAAEEHTFDLALYVGPKEYDRLKPLGYGKVMGTTFMAPLAMGLLWVLNVIYKAIPNYGVAIILLTALIKLVLFPLDRRSARSMKEMQKIQPLIKELQAKYKDDKRQLQLEQMKLFKEHKVNPLGGCFPILLQFPILYGMFTMLRNAVELWRAPFFSYINDLSKPDTLFTIPGLPLFGNLEIHILPILMTVFTILSQRLRGQSQTTDPQQKMMANMMPLIFLFIFYSFPSGLNLYWLCSTVFTFGVQLIVQKSDGQQQLPAQENQTHGNARKR